VAFTTPVNDSGNNFRFLLIPGIYSVRVSADGFDSVFRDDMNCTQIAFDYVCTKVGSVSQQIVVAGGEPLLRPRRLDVGNVVDTRLERSAAEWWRYADLARSSRRASFTPPTTPPGPLQRERQPRTAKQLS
jgi:hypothetical protein